MASSASTSSIARPGSAARAHPRRPSSPTVRWPCARSRVPSPRSTPAVAPDPYIHVRYRLAESTSNREIWRYEHMPHSWLAGFVEHVVSKGHTEVSWRFLRDRNSLWTLLEDTRSEREIDYPLPEGRRPDLTKREWWT